MHRSGSPTLSLMFVLTLTASLGRVLAHLLLPGDHLLGFLVGGESDEPVGKSTLNDTAERCLLPGLRTTR